MEEEIGAGQEGLRTIVISPDNIIDSEKQTLCDEEGEAMPLRSGSRHDRRGTGGADHRRLAAAVVAGAGIEAAALWRQTSRLGGEVVVRCRRGHLYTTIWIPGASLKALRLIGRRYQRCPVGGHWSLVAPVRESDLSEEQLRQAREHRDIRLP